MVLYKWNRIKKKWKKIPDPDAISDEERIEKATNWLKKHYRKLKRNETNIDINSNTGNIRID